MAKCVKNDLPQGSLNLLADSDRVKAPVAGAGPMDFEGDQTHDTQKGRTKEGNKKAQQRRQTENQILEPAENEGRLHSTPGDKATEMKQKIEHSESSITEALESAKNALQKIKAAMLKQKNVSIDIKTGLDTIVEALDKIEYAKKRQKLEQDNLTDLLWNRTRTLSSSIRTPTANTSTQKKRTATSPAESQGATPVDKRKRDNEAKNKWSKVLSKKEKRLDKPRNQAGVVTPGKKPPVPKQDTQKMRRSKRTRTEAVIIKPSDGKSYAEILKVIRGNVKPEETKREVKAIRQTRNGCVLLELGGKNGSHEDFSKALAKALGDAGAVENRTPKVTLEIRDMDSFTTAEEVKKPIEDQIKEPPGELKVFLTKPNIRAQIMAIAEMNERAANELLETSRIKVGWVNCRVRRRTIVERCFKCFGYGHQAGNCKGPDRGKNCYKCGETGHRAAACTAEPNCALCKEMKVDEGQLKHVPGSGKCHAFKQALDHAKGKSKWR